MFDIKNVKNAAELQKQKRQKIFIVGASVASLIASGEAGAPAASKALVKSGDVAGDVSDGDDNLIIGGNGLAGIVASGEGADTITGGAGVDVIRGAEGADTVTGGAGLDHMVVVGVTVNAGYTLAELQNLAGTGVDLSSLLDLDLLNNHAVSDLVAGDSIDGGADGAILYILGKANFAGVTLANISKIYLDNEVIMSDATLQGLKGGVLTELFGTGVIKAEAGLLDLDGVQVAAAIDIQDVDGNVIVPTAEAGALGAAVNVAENTTAVGTFSVTDASAVGDVTYGLSGTDAAFFNIDAATGAISFKAAPDFEAAADAGANNVYDVTVTATDEHTKTLTQNIAIGVTDAPEASIYVMNQFIRSGVETLVNSETADNQINSSVTALEDGGYVVAWETNNISQDDSLSAIKLQVFDADGHAVGGEILVNSQTFIEQEIPDVASLKNGGFVVSWTTQDESQDEGLSAVKAQIFDASGNKVGDEKLLNTETDDAQQDVKVVGLDSGGFVATWFTNDSNQDGDDSAVKAAIFNDLGDVVKAEFLVNTVDKSKSQGVPEIASLSAGGFVITWSSEDPPHDASGWGVRAAVYEDNGDVRKVDFGVNLLVQGIQYFQKVIGLDDGNFVVVWNSLGAANDADGSINAALFNANGVLQGGEAQINDEETSEQSSPAIAAIGGGGFVVSWRTEDATQDTSGDAVKARIFLDGGGAGGIGDEFLVNDLVTGNQRDPAMVMLQDGSFVITWTSPDGGLDVDGLAIKSQMYSAAPVFKYEQNKDYDFNIITGGENAVAGSVLGNVVISNIPVGVSFNQGFLDGTTLTLAQAQLDGLEIQIASGLNGRFELDISVSLTTDGVAQTTDIKAQISVAKDIVGTAGSNGYTDDSSVQHLDGKAGTDTLNLSGSKADYSFKISGVDIAISHNADPSHIDLIHSIEKLQFDGAGPAVDVFALDDLGDITELTGADFDAWLSQNYDLG